MPTSHDNHDFLLKVYRAYRRKDVGKIERLVGELPDPWDETLLAGLDESAWAKIARSEHKRQKTIRSIWIALGSLFAVITLSVIGVMLWRMISPPGGGTPTATAVEATVSATIEPSQVPATATPKPSDTLPPTEPPPTESPTPVPASSYLTNPADIFPALPGAYEQAWVLNDDSPAWSSNPVDGWKIPEGYPIAIPDNKIILESYKYWGDLYSETEGFVSVDYVMGNSPDNPPVPSDGLYEILVMDTPQFSSVDITYDILVNDNPVEPEIGTRRVVFNTNANQKTPTWLSLGFYRLLAGQSLKINVNNIGTLPAESIFAADRVVIGLVAKTQEDVLSSLPTSPLTLAVLMDDLNAELKIFNEVFVASKGDWQTAESALTWGHKFQYLVSGWANTIRVIWGPRGRLPAGKYQLWVRVPDSHATVTEAEYYLRVDGNPVDRTPPRILNQASHAGQWLHVADYTLPADASVQVVMEVAKGIQGEIGIDAVALVLVP